MERRIGVVVRWGAKGFGFLNDCQTSKQYFVHVVDVEDRIELRIGDRVEYEVFPDLSHDSRPRAVQVRRISSPARAPQVKS